MDVLILDLFAESIWDTAGCELKYANEQQQEMSNLFEV